MTKDFIEFDYGKLPKNVQTLVRRIGAVDENENVWLDVPLDQGSLVVYAKDKKNGEHEVDVSEGWMHPVVILLDKGRKAYVLEENPQKNQDASDLEFYGDIIRWARLGEQKDKETCSAITIIHDQFVVFLACLNYITSGSEAQIRSRRGRIQRAKMTACRIWREGKQKE